MPIAPAQKNLFTNRFRTVKRRTLEENHLHIPLVSILRWCIRPEVLWRHVPNGGLRDAKTAAKLKAMGVLPGSADLEFFWGLVSPFETMPRILFLELKLPNNRRSDAQVEFAMRAKSIGAEYHVATTIDEAIRILGERGLIKPNVEVCGRRW